MPAKSRKKHSTKKRISATKKKTTVKRTSMVPRRRVASSSDAKLAENFIALQKVMVNLAASFDDLSKRISKLLDIFEISAKSLAEKDFKLDEQRKDDKKMMQKIDNLFEQNKVIAKGITLMHDRFDEGSPIEEHMTPRQPPHMERPSGMRVPPSMRRTPSQILPQNQSEQDPNNNDTTGYKKSLTSSENQQQPPQFKKLNKTP